jgi:DNA-binding MarR family transcriptional regulator
MKIEEAIQQKQFLNAYQKAHVNILYTAAALSQQTSLAIKPFHLTIQQFNILRILRGRHPEPMTIKDLTSRMLDKMSNASRLVDKLIEKGLVVRNTCPDDRRRVDVVISAIGLQVVARASEAVEQMYLFDSQFLTEEEALLLSDLLDKIRKED